MAEKDFSSYGYDFQKSLIKSIIEDKKFGTAIIDVLEPKYFDSQYFRYIVQNIKEIHTTYKRIPTYNDIELKINDESDNLNSETIRTIHLDTLKEIKNHVITGEEKFIKDVASNFCRRQNLKREIKRVEKIIEKGEAKEFNSIEDIIKKALIAGVVSDNVRDVFDEVENALREDARKTIRLGIDGLDALLKGGLAIGELGIVLAGTGVGKSTLLTIFANTAYLDGHKVLHIFFEDNLTVILRKHYTIWTDITADEQPYRKDEVIKMINYTKKNSKGELKLLKLPSDSVTISEIKSVLRRLHSEGFDPDLVCIDYVDCISPEKATFGEEWKGEGNIMRHLESMTNEFNIALWVATQGNRDSIDTEVVTTDQMGGSIKKAQIGHIVLSVGKTLIQKEHNLATITLLKSRIGKDGIVFSNCTFDNEYLEVDTESQNTILGHKEEVRQQKTKRAGQVYEEKLQNELNDELLMLEGTKIDDNGEINLTKEFEPAIVIDEKESSREEYRKNRIQEIMNNKKK